MRKRHAHVLFCTILTTLVAIESSPESKKEEIERNRELYGYATIDPEGEFVAGTWGTWTLTYHVGRLGVDDGGRIFVLTQAATDWGPFQVEDPEKADYMTVRTTGKASVTARFEPRHASPRPWWRGAVITVTNGYLKEGDTVSVTLGDRSGGGPGSRFQTFDQATDFQFRVMVDVFNAVRKVRVLDSPTLRIVGGRASALEVIWPTGVEKGEPTWLLVRAKDSWGNPSPSYRGTIRFETRHGLSGLPSKYTFTAEDGGFHRFEGVVVEDLGTVRVRVADDSRPALSAESNALVSSSGETLQPYWGDLHGQSGETGGIGTIVDYFSYARGFAGADFASWAGNDVHITPGDWQSIQKAAKNFNESGRFVAYLGYEWSGNTPNGGDHNVIYLDDDRPIYRSAYVEEEIPHDPSTDRNTITALLETIGSERVMLMPHVGGRRANFDFFDSAFMPMIELYSGHGQFEWIAEEAIERGLKVGFVASSDDVYSKPGESIPGVGLFAVHGGLTCAYARGLDRESLWAAFFDRRVYGTTGERIALRFKAGDHWMGEEIEADGPVTFSAQVVGTNGIERIDLFRGLKRAYRHVGRAEGPLNRIKVIWRGSRSKHRRRQVVWQGSIQLSDGSFDDVRSYRFDYPNEELAREGDRTLSFRTLTSGDEDGVILSVVGSDRAVLTLDAETSFRNQFGSGGSTSEPFRLSIPIRDLSAEDWVHEVGPLDREVVVRRVAETYHRKASFTWTEKEAPRGTTAYWIRVLQQDGAIAWSSPIFVSRK